MAPFPEARHPALQSPNPTYASAYLPWLQRGGTKRDRWNKAGKYQHLLAVPRRAEAADISLRHTKVPQPTALKRKYDALVADLGHPPIHGGKRAKRDTMDTKNTLDKLLSMAKYFSRAVHPYTDIGLVMHAGSRSRWAAPVSADPTNTVVIPAAELATQERYIKAFDKLMNILSSESVAVLREAYKEDTHWRNLITKFRKAAADARQQDTSGLKHKTHYILPNPAQILTPPLIVSDLKSDRGVNHPMLRDAIVPWPLRIKINSRMAVEDGQGAAEAPLTPEATNALNALLNGSKLTNGKAALTASNFPSCFYADGDYDPENPERGLFRSLFLLRVARHIWTGPASAMDGATKIKKICAASAHGSFHITPEKLGYVGVHARTLISTSQWTDKDGKFDYEKFFNRIVDLFADADDPWVVETLEWYQKGIFGCGGHIRGSDGEESSDDEDSEVARIRARRAARSSTAPSD
ncbi:hypothetical protein C8R45DRAFT_1101350 [Mycena sanguinolenta]|nr:hypothetical protein C8R45DRAFT_1101350 [Mycena sanguinolenta]